MIDVAEDLDTDLPTILCQVVFNFENGTGDMQIAFHQFPPVTPEEWPSYVNIIQTVWHAALEEVFQSIEKRHGFSREQRGVN